MDGDVGRGGRGGGGVRAKWTLEHSLDLYRQWTAAVCGVGRRRGNGAGGGGREDVEPRRYELVGDLVHFVRHNDGYKLLPRRVLNEVVAAHRLRNVLEVQGFAKLKLVVWLTAQ